MPFTTTAGGLNTFTARAISKDNVNTAPFVPQDEPAELLSELSDAVDACSVYSYGSASHDAVLRGSTAHQLCSQDQHAPRFRSRSETCESQSVLRHKLSSGSSVVSGCSTMIHTDQRDVQDLQNALRRVKRQARPSKQGTRSGSSSQTLRSMSSSFTLMPPIASSSSSLGRGGSFGLGMSPGSPTIPASAASPRAMDKIHAPFSLLQTMPSSYPIPCKGAQQRERPCDSIGIWPARQERTRPSKLSSMLSRARSTASISIQSAKSSTPCKMTSDPSAAALDIDEVEQLLASPLSGKRASISGSILSRSISRASASSGRSAFQSRNSFARRGEPLEYGKGLPTAQPYVEHVQLPRGHSRTPSQTSAQPKSPKLQTLLTMLNTALPAGESLPLLSPSSHAELSDSPSSRRPSSPQESPSTESRTSGLRDLPWQLPKLDRLWTPVLPPSPANGLAQPDQAHRRGSTDRPAPNNPLRTATGQPSLSSIATVPHRYSMDGGAAATAVPDNQAETQDQHPESLLSTASLHSLSPTVISYWGSGTTMQSNESGSACSAITASSGPGGGGVKSVEEDFTKSGGPEATPSRPRQHDRSDATLWRRSGADHDVAAGHDRRLDGTVSSYDVPPASLAPLAHDGRKDDPQGYRLGQSRQPTGSGLGRGFKARLDHVAQSLHWRTRPAGGGGERG